MKNTIFQNWNFIRWFRLILSVTFIIGYFTFSKGDIIILLAGSFFGLQAIFNIGRGAIRTSSHTAQQQVVDADFEEVKTK